MTLTKSYGKESLADESIEFSPVDWRAFQTNLSTRHFDLLFSLRPLLYGIESVSQAEAVTKWTEVSAILLDAGFPIPSFLKLSGPYDYKLALVVVLNIARVNHWRTVK